MNLCVLAIGSDEGSAVNSEQSVFAQPDSRAGSPNLSHASGDISRVLTGGKRMGLEAKSLVIKKDKQRNCRAFGPPYPA